MANRTVPSPDMATSLPQFPTQSPAGNPLGTAAPFGGAQGGSTEQATPRQPKEILAEIQGLMDQLAMSLEADEPSEDIAEMEPQTDEEVVNGLLPKPKATIGGNKTPFNF